MVKLSEVAKIDSKGRVTIPLIMRESLGLFEGMYVLLIADTESREIILTPILPPTAELLELKIELKDVPGALANTAAKLASLGIDMIANKCAAVKRGETAECLIIVDISKSHIDNVEKLKLELNTLPEVKYVEVRRLVKKKYSSVSH